MAIVSLSFAMCDALIAIIYIHVSDVVRYNQRTGHTSSLLVETINRKKSQLSHCGTDEDGVDQRPETRDWNLFINTQRDVCLSVYSSQLHQVLCLFIDLIYQIHHMLFLSAVLFSLKTSASLHDTSFVSSTR